MTKQKRIAIIKTQSIKKRAIAMPLPVDPPPRPDPDDDKDDKGERRKGN